MRWPCRRLRQSPCLASLDLVHAGDGVDRAADGAADGEDEVDEVDGVDGADEVVDGADGADEVVDGAETAMATGGGLRSRSIGW